MTTSRWIKGLLASVAVVAPWFLATGDTSAQTRVQPVAVKAAKIAQAPTLDGDASDAAWKSAPVIELKAVKGVNFKDNKGETAGTLQAAYTADTLYMLITYEDPTLSERRAPYVKQADGSWKMLNDPDDKGGDNNKYYEDKLALIWNINKSIFGFDERLGCQASCHAGEPGKPYGNKYTTDEGELGDMWHVKGVRNSPVGQLDDQYLDHTRYDKDKAANAGRKSDASTGGGYADIKLVNGKPEFMNKDGKAANKGGTYWVKTADRVPFDDSKFVAGDEVASIAIAPFTGDRGDIALASKWANGKWVVEISRKLVTGSKTDVQFADLNATYGFGVSFFDNAQVRHAFVEAPFNLTFNK